MLREVMFRAMNEKNYWVYFSIWNINPPLSKDTYKNLCEFTGKLDKHGVRIYEGDKWAWRGKEGHIIFEKAAFYCVIGKEKYLLSAMHDKDFRITGNIYELNPTKPD